jgi:subtilisin family serine protease
MTGRRAGTAVLLAVAAAALPPVRPADALAAPAGQRRCAAASTTVARAVPWAQQRLAPQRVWMLTRGQAVTVAVVDTGVSRSAPALAGRVLAGKDVLTGGPGDDDCAGHGTFVAGLVAAGQLAGTGFAGVAPDARILPVRVTDQAGDVHPDVLAAGVTAAVDGGGTVIAVAPVVRARW